MFKLIRRTPWIALGAGAVYYADPANGPARRDRASARVRLLIDRAQDWWRSEKRSAEGDGRTEDGRTELNAFDLSYGSDATEPTEPVAVG